MDFAHSGVEVTMFKIALVLALSAAMVVPGRVQAQSLDDSVHHAPLPSVSATQAASTPTTSHSSSRATGALIGLVAGAGLGMMAGLSACDARRCAGSVAGATMGMAILGLGVGAAVSGDRTASGLPGRPAPRTVAAGLTIKF